jgi:hypothetical protein
MFFSLFGWKFNSLYSLQVLSLFLTHFLISPLACEKHFHVSCCFQASPHERHFDQESFWHLNVLTFQTILTLEKQLRFKQASWTITCFFHCLGESSTLYIAYKFWACAWLISSFHLRLVKSISMFHVVSSFPTWKTFSLFFLGVDHKPKVKVAKLILFQNNKIQPKMILHYYQWFC